MEKSLLELDDLTLITVTHKLIKSILINYDKIIVMKNGKIIEIGNFNDLLNEKGYFYSLYTIQNDNSI